MNNIKKTVLDNGITVLTEYLPYVQSFSLGFCFDVGSRDESPEENGITHFIEHMVFKGTKKRSARKIAEDIEAYGGYLNAFTSKEQTCYYGRGLTNHLKRTFDVISDMFQHPTFKASEIKKEANVVIDEMNDINDNPEELIFDKFEEVIFEGNPLSYPIIGTEENLRNFGQTDLFKFIDNKYGTNNLIISSAGAVEHEQLLKLVDKYLVKDLGKKTIQRESVTQTKPVQKEILKQIQQVHLIIGCPTYGYNDEKRLAVNILSHILGEGSSSRLFQSIREKHGIAYQLNSFLNSFQEISAFGVYLSTNLKQAEKAEKIIKTEFEKIRNKAVSDKELNIAKEYIKGNIILSLESMTSRMLRMTNSELYFKRIVPIDEIIEKINLVDAKQILDIANEVLDENNLSKIIISSDTINN